MFKLCHENWSSAIGDDFSNTQRSCTFLCEVSEQTPLNPAVTSRQANEHSRAPGTADAYRV